uniref:Lipocalin-like domain-containing protein n=1 Tax=Panagrellus redivivus TaxID=6233 RepID=A0A7E4VNH7_PANRE
MAAFFIVHAGQWVGKWEGPEGRSQITIPLPNQVHGCFFRNGRASTALPRMSSPGWTGAEEIESLRNVGEVGGAWILSDSYLTLNMSRVYIYRRDDDPTAEMVSLETSNGRRIVVHRTKKESILMTSEGSGKTTRYLLCKRKDNDN